MAARDVILISILIFSLGIGFFTIYFATNTMVVQLTNHTAINQSEAATDSFNSITTDVIPRLDYLIFVVFMSLSLALMITSWFISGNPIFMFFYFIFILIGVVISAIMSNVWETATQASVFGTTIAAFPITNHLILNLPMYIGVVGFIGVVVMFAKPVIRGGQL